ncbi:acyl-CoA thioesterase [Hydrogenimonas sp. SS33]|uniref:acyl-CoA thioesterase n=1 Tax=Hydrogenimonas leucolamina TaxID=2954236 RepID=UPI00336C23E2
METTRRFVQKFRVPEEAIDSNGHVNNVVYLQWFADAAAEHARQNGWGEEACRRRGTMWVARKHCIEYLHPAFENDALVLTTWIERVERVKAIRKYTLEKEDGTPVSRGESEWVYLDAKRLRPIRIPDGMRHLFLGEEV